MEIDRSTYKVLDRRSPSNIHYVLNPGLALNELILGQRVPKIILIDQTSEKPLMERSYVPCPHCNHLHDSRTWSSSNKTAFRNWFGLYCPSCGEIIPCLRNWTSWLLLALTYPFWFWWIDSWKQSWLKKQPKRFERIDVSKAVHKNINWVKIGLFWGGGMFLFTLLALPFVPHLTGRQMLMMSALMLPIWLIFGLLFGFFAKFVLGKRASKK